MNECSLAFHRTLTFKSPWTADRNWKITDSSASRTRSFYDMTFVCGLKWRKRIPSHLSYTTKHSDLHTMFAK